MPVSRPFVWLTRGLSDLRDNLPASLAWGAVFAVIGHLVLAYAAGKPHLFTAAVSGFFIVGPLAAAGLYEISRRQERGEPCKLGDSIRSFFGRGGPLLHFGLFLAVVLISWERISAVLFALFHDGNIESVTDFHREVLSGNHLHFLAAYGAIGGVIAALLFSLTAVALPLMMDRDTDVVTAMLASMRAVGHNLPAMLLWACLIVVLIAIGFATWMIGLAITLPLVGHATWHAYRDLVRPG